MNLTIFQSGNGDCLLLTGAGGKTILVDGGLSGSFGEHVAPAIASRFRTRPIDLVYVSHIDQDHIGGILRMMDDAVEWRVYDYQVDNGNKKFPRPRSQRPPRVKSLWHNAFKDQVEDTDGQIEAMLVANARLANLDARVIGDALAIQAVSSNELVASVKEGLLLSKRVSPAQLDIPINQDFGGQLIFVGDSPLRTSLGEMNLSVIGPFKDDLDKLRREWNKWLQANQEAVLRIRQEARLEAGMLPIMEGQLALTYLRSLATELGNRNLVTAPNLASLMLLVEEGGKSVLLTGDGHARDILKGLESHGKLDASGRLHVDVLKIQHHGSQNNIDADFCKAITADHYVFCGNGAHKNPHLDVLDTLIQARLASADAASGKPFSLWFSSSAKMAGSPSRQEHMRQVEDLVRRAARRSRGKIRYRFLTRGSRLNLKI